MAEPGPEEASSRSEASDQQHNEHRPPEARPEIAQVGTGTYDGDIYDEDLVDYDEEDEADGEPVEWFDEQGRRHVRRAAPEGTEEILEKEVARQTGLPDRLERWRQRSATGAVATAFALGLQAALDTKREEPAIVMETSGDPPTDLPVEAQLEQLGPRQSTVKVRRWLVPPGEDEPGARGQPEATPGQPEGEAGRQ